MDEETQTPADIRKKIRALEIKTRGLVEADLCRRLPQRLQRTRDEFRGRARISARR